MAHPELPRAAGDPLLGFIWFPLPNFPIITYQETEKRIWAKKMLLCRSVTGSCRWRKGLNHPHPLVSYHTVLCRLFDPEGDGKSRGARQPILLQFFGQKTAWKWKNLDWMGASLACPLEPPLGFVLFNKSSRIDDELWRELRRKLVVYD